MPVSYIKNKFRNVMQGIMTNPTAGLNEFIPPTEISDTLLSDCLHVDPYKNEALAFNPAITTLTTYLKADGDNIGKVRAVLMSDESDDANGYYTFYLFTQKFDAMRILKVEYTGVTDTITTFSCTATATDTLASSCVFVTEAETYYCFASIADDRLHYVTKNGGAYGYVDLPFTPVKLLTHANRIFAIGSPNKLWWCRVGDLFSWYSAEYDDDYVAASQNLKNGAFTITTQPNTTRLITFKHTKTDTVDTLGSIALVGKDFEGNAQTETITPVANTRVVSQKHYSEITSATMSGWTQGGATPDTIEIGIGPTGSKYIQADAGYWTVEKEVELYDFCLLGGDIYLFGPHNIHVFQGSTYETFNLRLAIPDLGLLKANGTIEHKCLVVYAGVAYFIYGDAIYEFNASSYPKIISRPALTNEMQGGISLSGQNWALAVDDDYLWVYETDYTPTTYYKYSHEYKTWWKFYGLTKTDLSTTDPVNILLCPSYTKSAMLTFISIYTSGAPIWCFSLQQGVVVSTAYPYIITKAFNVSPATDGTLTDLALQIQGTKDAKATITVQYQTSIANNTFTTAQTYTDYTFTGDVEVIRVPFSVSSIHRSHHYRIKIIVQSATQTVYLFGIERRFRLVRRNR